MSSRFRLHSNDIPVALIVAAFVLQVFFFAPLQVLAQNFGEFSVRYVDVFVIHFVVSFGLVVVLFLLVRRFRVPLLLSGLTYLSVTAFLESRFLLALARHHPFDGKLIDWQALQWLSRVELIALLVLGILIFAFRKRTQLLSLLSLFVLVFVALGFFYETLTNIGALRPNRQINEADSVYLEQFHQLSNKRNIIHIVPDQTQGAMLHDILASDYERYSGVFDGFTLFTQATGRYKGTYPSVVYYMTGEAPEPDFDLVLNQPYTWDYIDETLRERSIVTVLSQNAFKTFGFQFHPGIFCKGPFTACTGTHEEVFGGVAVKSPGRRIVLATLTALDVALFQMTPLVIREQIYDDGRWFARKLAAGAVTHSGILDIFTENMRSSDNPGSYNYIHHAGAHAPLLFDRNCRYIGPQAINWQNQREQVMCTLAQLEEMIQALKKIGVYDSTMIVINGDHGTPWLPPSFPARSGKVISRSLMGMASTLLLVKPPAAHGPLVFSSQPVTMGDIPATIAAAFGLDHSYPGVQMFNGEPAAERERHYYDYESSSMAHSLQALPNLTRYRIRGNVFDERNWVPPNTASAGAYPSQLRMDHAEFPRHAQGFSLLEQHDVPVRWVDGTQARVFLAPPSHGSVALVFDSFVPASIGGQWMEISVGGRVIAKLDAKELQGRRHIVSLPEDLPSTQVLAIEFTLGKTLSSKKDPRRLSILFSYIGLVPAG